jgi:hypothetical protein
MAFVGRLLLRVMVVALGALLAIVVGTVVSFIANWNAFTAFVDANGGDAKAIGGLVVAVAWALVFALSTYVMLMPAVIGVLVSEMFAIRAATFHALNGAVSMWVGWWTSAADFREQTTFYDSPLTVLAVGLAAGFAYWAVAGWSAGVFRPAPVVPAAPR